MESNMRILDAFDGNPPFNAPTIIDPRSVGLPEKTTDIAIRVLALLITWADDDGSVVVSRSRVAKMMCRRRETIARALRDLETAKVIISTGAAGRDGDRFQINLETLREHARISRNKTPSNFAHERKIVMTDIRAQDDENSRMSEIRAGQGEGHENKGAESTRAKFRHDENTVTIKEVKDEEKEQPLNARTREGEGREIIHRGRREVLRECYSACEGLFSLPLCFPADAKAQRAFVILAARMEVERREAAAAAGKGKPVKSPSRLFDLIEGDYQEALSGDLAVLDRVFESVEVWQCLYEEERRREAPPPPEVDEPRGPVDPIRLALDQSLDHGRDWWERSSRKVRRSIVKAAAAATKGKFESLPPVPENGSLTEWVSELGGHEIRARVFARDLSKRLNQIAARENGGGRYESR